MSDKKELTDMDSYDLGLMNDHGGGDVDWWHNYLRHTLADAEEHYQQQYEAEVNRVCRYIWKSVGGDPEFFMWVSEDCGRMELSRPDEGKHCRDCGGKVEVVDE